MDVTWRIEPTAAGCHVSIEHDFRPRLPVFAALVDRWFTRPIAGRTLATFKALAEALVPTDPQSGPVSGDEPIDMNERRRVWITGIGMITAIGTGREAFRAGLRAGALAGQADRPVRSGRRSARRSRPRSTTSIRSPGCRPRPPASSTASASSASWRGGSRSRTRG